MAGLNTDTLRFLETLGWHLIFNAIEAFSRLLAFLLD